MILWFVLLGCGVVERKQKCTLDWGNSMDSELKLTARHSARSHKCKIA